MDIFEFIPAAKGLIEDLGNYIQTAADTQAKASICAALIAAGATPEFAVKETNRIYPLLDK